MSCAQDVGGLPKLSARHPPGAETPQDMERYIELHLRVSRQNQNADPVTRAVAGESPLRRLGASSIHGHGWTVAHVGTSEGANQYSSKVQQCPRCSALYSGGSPTLSAPERGLARSTPSLCKQGVRGSSPLGSTPSWRWLVSSLGKGRVWSARGLRAGLDLKPFGELVVDGLGAHTDGMRPHDHGSVGVVRAAVVAKGRPPN